MKTLYATLAALLLSMPAFADEVIFHHGGSLEGTVRESGDRVIIEMHLGTVTVPRDRVAAIRRGPSALDHYAERYSRVEDSEDPQEFYRLALWAEAKGLSRYVGELLNRVLALDPEHEGAHRMLGHTYHEDRWMTRDEYMSARGYVRFRGEWIHESERETILKAEAIRREEAREREAQRRAEAVARARAEVYENLAERRARSSYTVGSGYTSYLYPVYGTRIYSTPFIVRRGFGIHPATRFHSGFGHHRGGIHHGRTHFGSFHSGHHHRGHGSGLTLRFRF